MTEHVDRRQALMAATAGALALTGAAMVEADDKPKVNKESSAEARDLGFATKLSRVRCFHVALGWDGSNRRNGSTFKVEAPAGTFTTNGVYIQQTPGDGGWHEVARFKRITTTDKGMEIEWSETGGQNYRIWLLVKHEVDTSQVAVSITGPYVVSFKDFVDAPFPV